MIPMEPRDPPAPPAAHLGAPPELLTLHDAILGFWHWFDATIGLPHWVLLWFVCAWVAVAVFGSAGKGGLFDLGDRWWTTNPRDTGRILVSDLRKDSEAGSASPPRDRSWRCRFCGERGSLYGTGQQWASAALAHTAKCPRRPGAPPVRRCTECAAPIDPVDDLLDGLFEDDEPGPTGWEPGMPAWGTPPLLPLRNHAQAELFRQMISNALGRSKGGPV